MKKAIGLLSAASILSIIVGLLIIIINADSSNALDPESSNTTPTVELTSTGRPPPGQTNTPTPVDRDYIPVVLGMNITPTATSTVSPYTPTVDPTSTGRPPPGQTNTPTPVDRDYIPVVLGMNITPTATSTVSPYTPTKDPTATPRPGPGTLLQYP